MTAPTIAQLRNLADRARKGLTDAEADRLLEGINRLAEQPRTTPDNPTTSKEQP